MASVIYVSGIASTHASHKELHGRNIPTWRVQHSRRKEASEAVSTAFLIALKCGAHLLCVLPQNVRIPQELLRHN